MRWYEMRSKTLTPRLRMRSMYSSFKRPMKLRRWGDQWGDQWFGELEAEGHWVQVLEPAMPGGQHSQIAQSCSCRRWIWERQGRCQEKNHFLNASVYASVYLWGKSSCLAYLKSYHLANLNVSIYLSAGTLGGLQILPGGFWWLSGPLRMQGKRSVGPRELPAAVAEVSAPDAVHASEIPDADRRNLWLCSTERLWRPELWKESKVKRK